MTIRAVPLPQRRMPMAMPLPVGARARAAAGQLPAFAADWAVLLTVIAFYFVLRGVAPARPEFAVSVTNVLIDIERGAGIFWEPDIQDASLRWHAVQEFANFTYAYLHFPVMAVVGAWLWWTDRRRFAFVRNVLILTMVLGLVFYYLAPAAPPRLMAAHGYDLGFTDTVFGGNTSVQYAQPSFILNEYAAIPSFHFGWILLSAMAVWANTGRVAPRALAAALVVLMTWAIVASANHLFIDAALGGVVVGVAWWAVGARGRHGDPG